MSRWLLLKGREVSMKIFILITLFFVWIGLAQEAFSNSTRAQQTFNSEFQKCRTNRGESASYCANYAARTANRQCGSDKSCQTSISSLRTNAASRTSTTSAPRTSAQRTPAARSSSASTASASQVAAAPVSYVLPSAGNNYLGYGDPNATVFSKDTIDTKDRDLKRSITEALRKCNDSANRDNSDFNPQVGYYIFVNGSREDRTITSCQEANDLANEYLNKEEAEKCVEAFEKHKEDIEDKTATAEKDLTELRKDRTEALSNADEDIAKLQEDLTKADLAYQEALQDQTEALSKLQEEMDEKTKAKMDERMDLQKKHGEIHKARIPNLNTALKNELNKCKNEAEKGYAEHLKQVREIIKAGNRGAIRTPKVNVRKIKNEVKLYHADCVSNANTSYQAQLENLMQEQSELSIKIQQLTNEINELIGAKRTEKILQINQQAELVRVRTEAEKARINQNIQRIQNTTRETVARIDEEIRKLRERVASGDFSGNKSTPSWVFRCCEGQGRAARIKDSISWFKGGLPPPTQCRTASSNTRSKSSSDR